MKKKFFRYRKENRKGNRTNFLMYFIYLYIGIRNTKENDLYRRKS